MKRTGTYKKYLKKTVKNYNPKRNWGWLLELLSKINGFPALLYNYVCMLCLLAIIKGGYTSVFSCSRNYHILLKKNEDNIIHIFFIFCVDVTENFYEKFGPRVLINIEIQNKNLKENFEIKKLTALLLLKINLSLKKFSEVFYLFFGNITVNKTKENFSYSFFRGIDYLRYEKKREALIAAVSVFFILQIIIAAGVVSAEQTESNILNPDKKVKNTFDNVINSNNILDRLDIISTEEKKAGLNTSTQTIKLSSDESFEKTVSECIISAKSNFRGPGLKIIDSSVTVFDLIPDSDVSDPDYLEREKGIIISLNYSSGYLNNIQRTLWAYEIDSTSIVKEIFNSGIEEKTGFIIICMADLDGSYDDVKFKLTASDGQKYSKSINEGQYLRKNDWSDVVISPESNLCLYEDPDTRISSYGVVSFEDVGNDYVFLSDDELKDKISERAEYLNMLSQKISDLCLKKNWEEASLVSEELIESSEGYIEEADQFVVLSDLDDLKENYVRCLETYSDAGMCFWYGTTFFDEEKIKDGQSLLKKSIGGMNEIFTSLDVRTVDESKIIKAPAASMLPKAQRLTEVYNYKDVGGYNDISIKIEGCGYKESYWLKNDDSSFPIIADFDKKFFYVVVDVTHMGYRGGGISSIKTPANSDFTLYYMGDGFKDSTPKDYIISLGVPYIKKTLSRREHFEAVLIYEVPLDFSKEESYIKVDLGEKGIPLWCFKMPEISSLNIDGL